MDPSDHDQNDPHNGAPASDHEPTHANAPLGEGWLRSVVEHSSEIVTVVDPDGTLRYANPAWERTLGHDPEQAVGAMNVLDHVHPEDLAHVLEETEAALAEGGVVTNEAEYRFRCEDGSWRWMQSVGTYLLDDPAVGGVVVVSRDVTERKEAEEALRRSEAEIFSVLESITDGFFSLDHELRFAYVNPQAELLLGRSREDLVGEMLWEDPTFYPHYLRAVAEGETVEFEGYYPPLGAWYGVRAYPSASGLSVYFQDITGRKKAEEKLRFQAQLLGAVGEAVIALDTEGRVLYWNRAAEEMYGWSSEEIMGRRLREMVVPEYLQGQADEIAEQLREGRIWAGEFEVRRRDGTTFPVEGTDTPVFGEDGNLVGVIGVLRDITERKEAEEALRQSEARFHALVENALDIVMVTDAQGAIRYVSPSVERVLGYRAEEMLGTVTVEYVHPDDSQRALTELSEVASKPGVHPVPVEGRVRHKDGSWRHVEGRVNNLLDDPIVEGIVFNHRDVTERKQGEEEIRRLNEELENRVKERTARLETALAELRSSEERYRLLVESAEDYAIFMVDPGGRVLDWNAGAERIFGYKEEDIVGEPGSILFTPEDIRSGAPERELEKAREEGRAADERWHLRKDGSRFWASGFVRPVRDDAGNLRGFAKVARDITERRRTEDELRASEERFRATFDQAAVGVAHVGLDGRWLRVNNKLFEITGYPRDELLERTFQDITHPDDLVADLEQASQLLAGEIETYSMEKRYIKKDRSTVWINLTGSLVREPSGEPAYFIAVLEDITQRKKAEEALSQSESRYRAVVEQSADGIYLVDAGAGRILETNPALRDMLGYGAEELRGMELHEIVAHDPEDVYANVERTLKEGWRFIRGLGYRRKDGSVVEVEVAASAIDYGNKQVICAAIRDITERKRAEEARREIRDTERRRIARDLHDGVLQDLSYTAAAIGMIMLQAEEAGLKEQLQAAIDAVRRGAEGLREVVNDLRIEDEDGRPFTEMVESLVRRNRTMAKHVEISMDVEERVPTMPLGETGTQASRIIQEALTNARRHAGAKRISVSLRMDGPDLIAEVADDGVGFGHETLPGVGLSSMRERAAVIGGDLEIESEKEWGTRVRLRIPLAEGVQG